MKTWHVIAGGLVGLAAYLILSSTVGATVANTVRFPRYDTKPVKIHVVYDSYFDTRYVTDLHNGALVWSMWLPDVVQFDFPPPVMFCGQVVTPNTICVTTGTNLGYAGWTSQVFLPKLGVDGKHLIRTGYITIGTDWWSPDNIQGAFCHDIGHNLGVDEGDNIGVSCMNNPTWGAVAPDGDEINLVRSVYQVRDHR